MIMVNRHSTERGIERREGVCGGGGWGGKKRGGKRWMISSFYLT